MIRVLHKCVTPLLISYVGSNPILFHHKSILFDFFYLTRGMLIINMLWAYLYRDVAQFGYERCIWDAEVASSSLVIPIIICPNSSAGGSIWLLIKGSKVQVLLRTPWWMMQFIEILHENNMVLFYTFKLFLYILIFSHSSHTLLEIDAV